MYNIILLKLFKPSATKIVCIIFKQNFIVEFIFQLILFILYDKYNIIMVEYNFST